MCLMAARCWVLQADTGPRTQHHPCHHPSLQLEALQSRRNLSTFPIISLQKQPTVVLGLKHHNILDQTTSNWPNTEKTSCGEHQRNFKGIWCPAPCIPSTKKMSQHCWRLHDVIWHKVVNTEALGEKKSPSSVLSSRYFTGIYCSRWK